MAFYVRDEFEQVSSDYFEAYKNEDFAGHPLREHIEKDLAASARTLTPRANLLVTAGCGKGRWAEVPWVNFMNPLVTTSAERGYYVVYLLGGDASWHLSLNQGVRAVKSEFPRDYLRKLTSRAAEYADHLAPLIAQNDALFGPPLQVGPINLDVYSKSGSGVGYEAGSILSINYPADGLPSDLDLSADLERMLDLYSALTVILDGLRAAEEEPLPGTETLTEDEKKKFKVRNVTHERFETALRQDPAHIKEVKQIRGYRCEVCSLQFDERYGDVGQGFIEAHHLIPLATLDPANPPAFSVDDFAVLCANCHRMLHRRTPVITPDELKGMLLP